MSGVRRGGGGAKGERGSGATSARKPSRIAALPPHSPSLLYRSANPMGAAQASFPARTTSAEKAGPARIPLSASPRRPARRWAPCGHWVNICRAH